LEELAVVRLDPIIQASRDSSGPANSGSLRSSSTSTGSPTTFQKDELDDNEEFAEYKAALKGLQFEEMGMEESSAPPTSSSLFKHHYNEKILADAQSSPAKMTRIAHEMASLSTGLPLHWSSSVFLRVSDSRLDVLRALISGPQGTPYEDGLFLFDVYCPSEYPKVPPLVNLQTTGLGTVRFNPNLYTCGKVCLSLLGTWPGGPNEMWQENESTLLQVFVSIQSLIFVDRPYFNEPGYESYMGTDHGDLMSYQYNEAIRVGTLKWAILDPLQHPPTGFEEVVKKHFTIKRISIMKNILKWLAEAKTSTTSGHLEQMRKLVGDIETQLQILAPFTVDDSLRPEGPDIPPVTTQDSRWDAAAALHKLFPQFSIGMHHYALVLCKDQSNTAVDWLMEQGDEYAASHPDIDSQQPPSAETY
jgi:baculoviral IAP repeat-containing protein 6